MFLPIQPAGYRRSSWIFYELWSLYYFCQLLLKKYCNKDRLAEYYSSDTCNSSVACFLMCRLIVAHLCSKPCTVRVNSLPWGTSTYFYPLGLLPDTWSCGLPMCRERRERIPCHRLQSKPLLSDPGVHHDTCVTHDVMHVGIANLRWRGKRSRHSRRYTTRNFLYLVRGPWNTNERIDTYLNLRINYVVICDSYLDAVRFWS